MYRGTRWDMDNCILCSKQTNEGENYIKEGIGNIHLNRFRKYLGEEKALYLESIKTNKYSVKDLEILYLELKNKNYGN